MENQKRKINVWSEEGMVYSLEEGDTVVYDMDVHVREKHANDQLSAEFQSFRFAGYEVVIGKPDIVKAEEEEVVIEEVKDVT